MTWKMGINGKKQDDKGDVIVEYRIEVTVYNAEDAALMEATIRRATDNIQLALDTISAKRKAEEGKADGSG